MSAEIDVESLAVSIVTTEISKTGYLVPYIPTKDKGPSFDGCVLVYGHKGINHKKRDMVGRVDVQVKGCVLKAPEVVKKSYQMDISDLQNFLEAGGAMLLVVSFGLCGEQEQIYYSQLLPFELKHFLEDCTEEQKTKSVPLTPMPKDKDEISDLFINFVRNYKLQRAYVGSSFEIDGDKVKKEDFGDLSFGFTSVQNQSNYNFPFEYFFTHGTYLYTDIGYDVKMPVDYMDKVNVIFSENQGEVKSGDTIFYENFKRIILTDHEEIQIGRSHRLILDVNNKTLKYKYKLKGSLKERLNDEKFLLKILQTKGMKINGLTIPIELKNDKTEHIPDMEKLQKHIEWSEKVDKTLKLVHAKEDLDCENLSEKDERNLHLLVDGILEKKKVDLDSEGNSIFGIISIGNLKLLICALHRTDDSKFDLFGYYDAPVIFKGVTADKIEFDSTYFLMLTKDEMIELSNIDLPIITKHIKKITISPDYIDQVTLFLLELIKVYDITNNDEYYNAALELCNWLKRKDSNKASAVHVINHYQLLKRKNNLSEKEILNLRKITRGNVDLSLKVGAYILLGEEEVAKELYEGLDEVTKQDFSNYPICKFCKKLQDIHKNIGEA